MIAPLSIAIVGRFQQGKSTLVNALLSANKAKMGRGARTTSKVHEYELQRGSGVKILDTPGKDANATDDRAASEAIAKAAVVLILHPRDMDERYRTIVEEATQSGRRCISVFNCLTDAPPSRWNPQHPTNLEICDNIETEIRDIRDGIAEAFIPVSGRIVYPVNILWARFGLGLFRKESELDRADERRIRLAAKTIGIPEKEMTDEVFRKAILDKSGFLPLEHLLKNLPLELLKHVVSNPQPAIDRIADRFAKELKIRWTAA